MKFNVQRVLTPAYLTSVALMVVGVLLALAWYPVAAWIFVLLGLGLNAMAVSVTEIHDGPRAESTAVRRRPSLSLRRSRTETPAEARSETRAQARGERADRRATAEPDADTLSNPVVPQAGSSSLREPH